MTLHDHTEISVREAVKIIRARISLGYMPGDLGQLLDRRGTVQQAVQDLARFTGFDEAVCMQAVEIVYGI
jgi:hypothetical protein